MALRRSQWIDGPYHPADIGQVVWTYDGVSGRAADTQREFGFLPDLDSIRIYPGEPGYTAPPLPDVPTQISIPPGVVTPTPTPIPLPPVGATPNVPVPAPPPPAGGLPSPMPGGGGAGTPSTGGGPIGVDWLYGKRDAYRARKSRIEEQLEAKRRYDERSRKRAEEARRKYEAEKRAREAKALRTSRLARILRGIGRVTNPLSTLLEVLWPTDLGDATLPTSRRTTPDFPPPRVPTPILDTGLPPLPPTPTARRTPRAQPPSMPTITVSDPILDTQLPTLPGSEPRSRSSMPSSRPSSPRAPTFTLPDWAGVLIPASLIPRSGSRVRLPSPTFFAPPLLTTPAPTTPFAPLTPPAPTPVSRTPTLTSAPPSLSTPTSSSAPTSDPRCRCPKPKKRKRGCTNELIYSRSRDGFIYTKRKQTCPPSKSKRASVPAARTRISSAARRLNTAAAATFSAWG